MTFFESTKSTRAGFGDGLLDIAERIPGVVTIDADLRHSVQTLNFSKKYPDRALQVGIAEANMIGVAAGLATAGKIPFAATFAIFATGQVYNQIRQSVCYSEKNVKIVGTHAGILTGEDGATHQALEDISMMRALPNMRVFCPADYYEARAMTALLAESDGPAYLRLGRADIPTIYSPGKKFKLGQLDTLLAAKKPKAVIFATGTAVPFALQAAIELKKKGIELTVANLSSIKPFPTRAALRLLAESKLAITVEDHQITGGIGSAIAEIIAENGLKTKLYRHGMRDQFGESGKPLDLLKKYELDAAGIKKHILKALKK